MLASHPRQSQAKKTRMWLMGYFYEFQFRNSQMPLRTESRFLSAQAWIIFCLPSEISLDSSSVTRCGDFVPFGCFLEPLGDFFLMEKSPMILGLLGQFWKIAIKLKFYVVEGSKNPKSCNFFDLLVIRNLGCFFGLPKLASTKVNLFHWLLKAPK